MNEITEKIIDNNKDKDKQKVEPLSNEPHCHESDGLVYMSYPPQHKCKICGMFYK